MKHHKFRLGSMQLSIEAIIILVIAFVFLGLVIFFVKNFFGIAGKQVQQQLTQGQICNTANGDNPIVPNEFQIVSGASSPQDLCVLNNAIKPINNGGVISNCYDSANKVTTAVSISSAPQSVDRGQSKTYKVTVSSDKTTTAGSTYICNVGVKELGTDGKPTGNFIVGPIQVTVEVT